MHVHICVYMCFSFVADFFLFAVEYFWMIVKYYKSASTSSDIYLSPAGIPMWGPSEIELKNEAAFGIICSDVGDECKWT